MNREQEQRYVIAGIFALLLVIPLKFNTASDAQTKRRAAEAMAVAEAIQEIEGIPNVIANFPPMLFKTDEDGVLYAQYADGWKRVRLNER